MDGFWIGFILGILAHMAFNYVHRTLSGWARPMQVYQQEVKASVSTGKKPIEMTRDAIIGGLKLAAFWGIIVLVVTQCAA